MARRWLYGLITITMLLLTIGSFVLGVQRGRALAVVVTEDDVMFIQADLALSHLQHYRELEADLSRGCTEVALSKVRARADTQEYVLAGILKDHPRVVEGILARRAPELLVPLRDFKSKYLDGWTEPKCASS